MGRCKQFYVVMLPSASLLAYWHNFFVVNSVDCIFVGNMPEYVVGWKYRGLAARSCCTVFENIWISSHPQLNPKIPLDMINFLIVISHQNECNGTLIFLMISLVHNHSEADMTFHSSRMTTSKKSYFWEAVNFDVSLINPD